MAGEVTKVATHQDAQVSGLVPWLSRDLVLNNFLDNVDSSGHVVEVLTPCAKTSFTDYRYVQTEGDRSSSLPI
jgi:hypothetical protein